MANTITTISSEIKSQMEQKSTDELLSIWKRNDRTAWRDDSFEAVRQVLEERFIQLPVQPCLSHPEEASTNLAFIKALQLCLFLSGVTIFLSRLTEPSLASLVSPILCLFAAVMVAKGRSKIGIISLMLLPILATLLTIGERPNFKFEMYFGMGAQIMISISCVMMLVYEPKKKAEIRKEKK